MPSAASRLISPDAQGRKRPQRNGVMGFARAQPILASPRAPTLALTSRQASRVDHRGYSMYGPLDPVRAARWAVSLNWVDRCGAHSCRKSALLALYFAARR